MSVPPQSRRRAPGRTFYYPVVSEKWADRAAEVSGASGFALAILIWQAVKLAFRSRDSDPFRDGVRFTYGRVRQHVPMSRSTYGRALQRLADAGLIELVRPSQGAGNRVRIVPVPDEELWTQKVLRWRGE